MPAIGSAIVLTPIALRGEDAPQEKFTREWAYVEKIYGSYLGTGVRG